MRHGKHVHTALDGRPRNRLVFLNGRLIYGVVYADTRRGIVRVVGNPIKVDRWGKRVLTRTLRGVVEVRQKVGADGVDGI
jgi:hypothetical protein